MSKVKIVITGGGSTAWTPSIVKDMLLSPSLTDAEFVLYDINLQAARFCKAFLDKLFAQLAIERMNYSEIVAREILKWFPVAWLTFGHKRQSRMSCVLREHDYSS